MKNIYLLGATGSIGTQTLEIIKKHPKLYKIITITGYNNLNRLMEITKEFKPLFVGLKDEESEIAFKKVFKDVETGVGEEGLIKAATYNSNDENGYLLNALVGSIGLLPTVEAIKIKRNVLLANKETLVIAGDNVMALAKEKNVKIFPIDSEHSAIFQALRVGSKKNLKRIIITASGGAFRDYNKEDLKNVKPADALKHPNWTMGSKITIDSATMMNKGFEVIEAHHLFNIPYNRIETIIHKESIIHSIVEYSDTSMVAIMNDHSMIVPISYALSYPKRIKMNINSLSLENLGTLNFAKMDIEKYDCLRLAYKAIKMGGLAFATLNAANEVAVHLFLNNKIAFLDIPKIIEKELDELENIEKPTISEIIACDKKVKMKLGGTL